MGQRRTADALYFHSHGLSMSITGKGELIARKGLEEQCRQIPIFTEMQ